ncbi:tetratricopeptide repeat protein [Dokdonia sp.]|uniref:tetratricopeptide repeat protein n=1 Tax=Dokdonia sp. TaxID=2024995 RepID=UPI003265BE74
MSKYHLSALCCLFVFTMYAQKSTNDSLQLVIKTSEVPIAIAQAHYTLSKSFKSKKVDSAIYHLTQSYSIASKHHIDTLQLTSVIGLAKKYYHEKSDRDSSRYYLDIGYALNKKLQNQRELYSLNILKAYLYDDVGKYSEAIELHLENIKIADNLKNYKIKAYAFSGIADVYRLQGNGEKAVEYMEFARQEVNRLDSTYVHSKFIMSLNLALAYDKNNQLEKAVALLESMIPSSIIDGPFSEAILYHNLGRFYIINEEYTKADIYLSKAMQIDAWSSIPRRRVATLKELSSLYMATNRSKEALVVAKQVYEGACTLGLQYHLEDATRNLSHAYALEGDFKNSLVLKEEYIEIINNMFDQDKNELMLELDAKYQTSEKEKEIQSLTAANAITKRNTMIWILSTILALVVLWYTWFYQKKKNNFLVKEKELQLKTERNKTDLIALRLKNEKIFSKQQQQEKEIIALELKLKEKELTTNAMSLLQQKEQYESLIQKLSDIHSGSNDDDASSKIAAVIRETKASLRSYNWEEFQHVFEKVHVDFYNNLLAKFPRITPNEKKISAFLRLGLSTKDISSITNQTPHSILIARSRLRKKLGLSKEESLTQYISTF